MRPRVCSMMPMCAVYGIDARGLTGGLGGATGIADAEHAGPQPPGRMGRPTQRMRDGYPAGLDTMAKMAESDGRVVVYERQRDRKFDSGSRGGWRNSLHTLGFYPMEEARDDWAQAEGRGGEGGGQFAISLENYFAARVAPAPAPARPANERPKIETLLRKTLGRDATATGGQEAMPDPAKAGFWQVRVTVDLHDVHLEKQDDLWVGAVDVSMSIDGSRGYRTVGAKVTIPDAGLSCTHSIRASRSAIR